MFHVWDCNCDSYSYHNLNLISFFSSSIKERYGDLISWYPYGFWLLSPPILQGNVEPATAKITTIKAIQLNYLQE